MSMFFLCRHGERADFGTQDDIAKMELPFDPHLTETGKKQARSAGFFIQRKAQEAVSTNLISTSTPKYLILSSPFLRCIETANQIAKVLKHENLYDNAIFLDNAICESLFLYYGPTVLADLYVRTKTKADIGKYADIELKDSWIKGNIVPEHPETNDSCRKRMEFGYKYIKDYLVSEEVYKDVVVIMVSHGFPVRIVLETMVQYDTPPYVSYCSTSQFYYPDPVKSKEDYKVLVDNYHKHINEKVEEEEMKIKGFEEKNLELEENSNSIELLQETPLFE